MVKKNKKDFSETQYILQRLWQQGCTFEENKNKTNENILYYPTLTYILLFLDFVGIDSNYKN